MGLLVAFPGQGIDPVDLVRVLAEHRDDPLVAQLIEVTGRPGLLGPDALDHLPLADTTVAQPCIYTASVVASRAVTARGHVEAVEAEEAEEAEEAGSTEEAGPVVAVCGHSFGEIAALAYAGAITAMAGLDLVRRRAELCARVDAERPGRMMVLMRLDAAGVEWVRRSAVASSGGLLDTAVVNGPGQWVLSGDTAAVDAAVTLAEQAGGVGRPLPIGGAFHSPLLAPAVAEYADAVRSTLTGTPFVPLVSCTTQAAATEPDDLVRDLSRALVLPVDWPATLEASATAGATRGVDVGPGRTLFNLARFAPVLPFAALSPERSRRSAPDRAGDTAGDTGTGPRRH